MSIDLHNVTIELLNRHQEGLIQASSLAKFDFIRSTFSFTGNSNTSKEISLVSRQIKITDTQENSTSVFRTVLQVCYQSEAEMKFYSQSHSFGTCSICQALAASYSSASRCASSHHAAAVGRAANMIILSRFSARAGGRGQ